MLLVGQLQGTNVSSYNGIFSSRFFYTKCAHAFKLLFLVRYSWKEFHEWSIKAVNLCVILGVSNVIRKLLIDVTCPEANQLTYVGVV